MVTIDGLQLDAALSEQHAAEVEATEHPVESGADPTDHARLKPRVYLVEGFMTAVPLLPADQQARGLATGVPIGDNNFHRAAYDRLMELATSHRLVTIATELETYSDMMLLSLSFPRDPTLGSAVQFKASFRKIRTVDVQRVRLELQTKPTSVPKKPTGKTDQSKQVAEEAPAEDASMAKEFANKRGWLAPRSGKKN